jgi:uncharacterized protein YraI
MRSGSRSSLRIACTLVVSSSILAACQGFILGPSVTPKSQAVDCRYGPGPTFASIATLPLGRKAHILGTLTDQSWWQIKSAVRTPCWVAGPAVTTSGDLSRVPVVAIPSGLATALTISGPLVIHSACDNDTTNPVSFMLSMTTNGPAKVIYHLEVYDKGGTMLLRRTENAGLTFPSASTQTFDTGDVIDTDCGDFYVKAIVDSPNARIAQTSWSVVTP